MTQAEVRAMVRILELKEQIQRLEVLADERERKRKLRECAATVDCTRAAVRSDGSVVYLSVDKKCRVSADLGGVSHYNR